MNKPTGGRGKKAPYEQTHVRVPLPIKARVEELKEMFLNGSLDSYDDLLKRDYEKAREYEKTLTGLNEKVNLDQNLLTGLDEAISVVKQALKRKKSARETAAIILSEIYKVEIKPDDLKL